MELIFWILLFIVFYTFVGYALVLFVILQTKKLLPNYKKQVVITGEQPDVCMFVAAYNESAYVDEKVKNLLSLNYPSSKIQFLWITDGSNDGTPGMVRKYPQMEVHHLQERRGKINAMNRGMKFVKAPIVIYSDSNTSLNKEAINIIVNKFRDPKVGCIAGEKRIQDKETDNAAGSGENIYWKFESWVKKMDSELNSTVGAVGELFAIRTNLFEEVENDTILDDFIISLRIAQKGYKIAYTPDAYAIETASINVKEELKRKVRIAAGGLQTIARLKSILNPFKYKLLSFQYISHKVFRWTIAPISLFCLFPVNLYLFVVENSQNNFSFYSAFFIIQLTMYFIAFIGWFIEGKRTKVKLLFIPYYFAAINYASVLGWLRFIKGKQTVNWEKSKRA